MEAGLGKECCLSVICLFEYLFLGLNSAYICWGFLWAIMLQYHDTWQVSQ